MHVPDASHSGGKIQICCRRSKHHQLLTQFEAFCKAG